MPSRKHRAQRGPRKLNSKSRFLKEKRSPTPRELEVAGWIGLAKSNEQIAKLLGWSTETVKKHVQHLLKKLGVENRLGICVWCHREAKHLLPKGGQL